MKYLFFSITLFFQTQAFCQTVISGTVTDNKRNPVPNVSIVIVDSYDGATSDSLGNFKFTTTETGARTIEFSSTGYNKVSQPINLDGKPQQLQIVFKEQVTELNAVVITAGSFEAGDKKRGTVLSSLDVVTTAGSNGDVTGALKTLPGTQQVGESEGLFVRGGSATETKIFIDGNLVNNFFYSSKPGLASRGRFNPFLFKGTQFSAGGYSALYGQALSSALILETEDIAEQTEGNLNLSVVGIGGGIQKLAKNKNSSWGASYNLSHLQPLFQVVKQRQEFTKYPVYHDGDLNFRIKTKNGLVKYYGYFSKNKFGIRESDIDSSLLKDKFTLGNSNIYQNLNWRENFGMGWKLTTSLSYGWNKDDIEANLEDAAGQKQTFTNPAGYNSKNFNLLKAGDNAQVRAVVEKKLAGLSAFRFGGEHLYAYEKLDFTDANNQQNSYAIKDNITAAFAEYDFYLNQNLAVKPGVRLERTSMLEKWNIAPRLSLAYKLNKISQASLAYGKFYQNPENKYFPVIAQHPGFAEASHYILQYQLSNKSRLLRTEIFYKNYEHLYKTLSNPYNQSGIVSNNGHGYAKGLEIFWRDRKSLENFDYWISYSYLDTKRDYLNYPGKMVPDFAAKHSGSVVVKSFYLKYKAGINLSYTVSSGRPYYQFLPGSNQTVVIGDRGMTKPYNNLSASINYLPWLGQQSAKSFSVLVLMVNNVLGFKNVFNYEYGNLNGIKKPVLPSADRFIFFGWFMSFGVDRTQDAINNNL